MRTKRIRNRKLKNKPHVKTPKERKIHYKDSEGYRCAHCGCLFSNSKNARERGKNFATTEHICPKSLKAGFVHTRKNLCLLCEECNNFKRDKLVIPSTFYKYLEDSHVQELDELLIPLYEKEKDPSKKLTPEDIEWYDTFRKVERQFKIGRLYESKKLVAWVKCQSYSKRAGKLPTWKNGYMKRLHSTWSYLYADRMLNVYCKLQLYYNNKNYYIDNYNLHLLVNKLDVKNTYARYRILLHLYETYGLYNSVQFEFLIRDNDPQALKALSYLRKQYGISSDTVAELLTKV